MKPSYPLGLDQLCYQKTNEESSAFQDHWCGPDLFEHGKLTLIAKYCGEGDGQPVEIYGRAGPARSYIIKALKGKDSVGRTIPPFELSTGSGSEMAVLVANMAEAVSTGMLALGT